MNMQFAFTEEQQQLRAGARRFLAAASPPSRVRAAMATERGYDRELWERIAGELGWPALAIPEAYGGIGAGHVELVAVMEEVGRALLCAPLFSTVCLGAGALLVAGDVAHRQRWLPGIAEGETLATLAHTEASGRCDAAGITATARRDGGDYLLSGAKRFVVDGHVADLIVVAVRAPETAGAEGVSLFAVPATAPGVTRRLLPTMDATRKLAEIRLDDVRVPASDRLGDEGAGWPALERILDLAGVALAAEQVGGAEACLDMAVDYANTRTQFGRAIGSFQAIKHKCADMLVHVESARSACCGAGCAAAEDDPELAALAPMAKAYCSDAYFACAAENIQIHGGIGFTWEHDAHLYFKRARSSEALLGDPAYHRERLAQRIGLSCS
jgi:alkylation response protein AidB-like acyl-CoA dehydrogenase